MARPSPIELDTVGSPRWLLLLPRLAFVAFVATLSALLWFSHQQDLEEQRATLISDMLWLEQNLRFQMVRNEEILGQLGRPGSDSTANFDSSARVLLTNSTGLRQIFLFDLVTGRRLAQPTATDAQLVGEAQGEVPAPSTLRLVQSLGKPAYTASYPIVDNDWQMEVHVPIFRGGRAVAIAVGVYSLRRMIEESVPWWLAERYRVSVIDSGGNELTSRSKVLPILPNTSYELVFDPPGYGLLLSATPYQIPVRLIDRLLIIAVICLAIATLISIWMVRKHLQQRIRAEAALRKEYLFRQAMERSVQTGLRARDLSGRVLYVNEAFCRMVGWPEEELIGRTPPMPYWPDNALEEIKGVHDRILAGDGPTEPFELTFVRRSGEPFSALVQEAPLIDETGHQTGWMGSVVDISERKAAEEQALRQQERIQATTRLIAMGEMASGLAHELNQPLAAISSYCSGSLQLLQRQSPDSDVIPALVKAVEQTKRAGKIIRRIYALAKRETGVPERIDLRESLRSAITLIEATLRRQGVSLIENIPDTEISIVGDPVLIEQAIFNILRNASDAMLKSVSESHCIEVRLSTKTDYAQLSISDDGPGIPTQLGQSIFDPLFSTKTDGMGMGLAICRSIVESHKGRIWFEPKTCGGTIFFIRLPLSIS
jgi:two-component system sensor histidine kinase DctS